MTVESFAYEGEGIENVYTNDKWLIAMKNWRAANDIENISRLEVHYKTDEQFVLLEGSVALIFSEDLSDSSEIHAVKLEPGKVFSVPTGLWFNNVLSKDAKLIYIEDSNTGADNSVYKELTARQIESAKAKAKALL